MGLAISYGPNHVPPLAFPLKPYIEMRNEGSKCICVRLSQYSEPKPALLRQFIQKAQQVNFSGTLGQKTTILPFSPDNGFSFGLDSMKRK